MPRWGRWTPQGSHGSRPATALFPPSRRPRKSHGPGRVTGTVDDPRAAGSTRPDLPLPGRGAFRVAYCRPGRGTSPYGAFGGAADAAGKSPAGIVPADDALLFDERRLNPAAPV